MMQRSLRLLVLMMLALALPLRVVQAAATAWVGDGRAAARLITAVEATGSDAQLDAGLQLRLAPGWHAYWRTPGDAGVPPSIDWKGSGNVAAVAVAWPAPKRLVVSGLQNAVYEGGVVLPLAVTLAHPGAAARLHAEVDYAVCANVCVPYHATLDVALPAGLATPGPEAPLIAAARARVPGNFAASGLRLVGAAVAPAKRGAVLAVRVASDGAPLRAPDVFVEGIPDSVPGQPVVTFAQGRHVATLAVPVPGLTAAKLAGRTLDLTVTDGARAAEGAAVPAAGALPAPVGNGLPLGIIGVALLGGLILNLMPCVLPVLSLKLLALAGYAGAGRRHGRLGLLATAGGVIGSFLLLAATLIGLKAAGSAVGWGIQFQVPWFLAAMALLTTLFAASLWDWLPINLPGGIERAVGSVRGRGRLTDAFLLGAFATLLAASCSAPFVGTAIGFALARGPADILAVFLALGVGMAAPFLAVAAAPGLVAWLPRPGRWMMRLRVVLGFALIGTAVWLLSVLAIEAGPAPSEIAGGALAVLLAVLAGRHYRPSLRLAGGAAAVALAAIAVLVPALRGEAVPVRPVAAASGPWQRFNPASLPALVAGRHVVLVDVTAAWCLTCKVNELQVLDRAPVAERLRAPGVVAMRADWTRADPAITDYLQRFGRFGVPMDVVYGPGAPEGIALPELLTEEAVTAAFRRAAG